MLLATYLISQSDIVNNDFRQLTIVCSIQSNIPPRPISGEMWTVQNKIFSTPPVVNLVFENVRFGLFPIENY